MSQWYDLDALSYSPDNPNEGDIGGIYGSIKQHGYRDVVQVFGQQVKAGQHRLEALKWHLKEGYQATERDKCLRRGPEGQWQVEGLALDDMAPHQATAFMLAHNELTRRGHNDEAILAEVLAGLATEYEGETLAEATGYSAEALDDLLQDLAHEALQEGESEADRLSKADEYQAKWQVERGAIYRVGRHRLMCGDVYEDLALLVGEATIDLLHTDPPYGISIVAPLKGEGKAAVGGSKPFGSTSGTARRSSTGFDAVGLVRVQQGASRNSIIQSNIYPVIEGDDRPFDPTFLLDLAPLVVLWGGNYYADKLPISSGWIVWDKREDITRNSFADCELAWTNQDKPARLFHHLWNGLHKGSQHGEGRTHPTEKPVALFAEIGQLLAPQGTWLDLFCGSGAQLVAAEQTGATALGMDIYPGYVAVTLERLTALGLEAVRER